MFLIPDGASAKVVLAYEESKGLGKGPGGNHDETVDTTLETVDASQEPAEREDWGKNIYFHSFDYFAPETISQGTMINLPELDENNDPIITEDGLSYFTLNARRVRMLVQPPSNWGKEEVSMVFLYREGAEGHGHPANIIMRRFVGGYGPEHLECTSRKKHPETKEDICVAGSTNLNEDNRTPEPEGQADARAHRGFLRGDNLVVGYTYTENWGREHIPRYDFFVRRSFDGGKKFTNAAGIKEGPINLSHITEEDSPGWSVLEPRLYATPGTLKDALSINDVQNSLVYYAAYSTTHHQSNEPKDLFWTMTDNFGESYLKQWNDIAKKYEYPWFGKVTDNIDGGFAGAQIRTNPGGTKLFVSYQADVEGAIGAGPCTGNGNAGSDVCSNSTATFDPLLKRFDINRDGIVDNEDKNALESHFGFPADDLYDVNGDGVIDAIDVKVWRWGEAEFAKRGIRRHYLRARH